MVERLGQRGTRVWQEFWVPIYVFLKVKQAAATSFRVTWFQTWALFCSCPLPGIVICLPHSISGDFVQSPPSAPLVRGPCNYISCKVSWLGLDLRLSCWKSRWANQEWLSANTVDLNLPLLARGQWLSWQWAGGVKVPAQPKLNLWASPLMVEVSQKAELDSSGTGILSLLTLLGHRCHSFSQVLPDSCI